MLVYRCCYIVRVFLILMISMLSLFCFSSAGGSQPGSTSRVKRKVDRSLYPADLFKSTKKEYNFGRKFLPRIEISPDGFMHRVYGEAYFEREVKLELASHVSASGKYARRKKQLSDQDLLEAANVSSIPSDTPKVQVSDEARYLASPIPNVTCLMLKDFKRTQTEQDKVYGKNKCPKLLPCRKLLSCKHFRTGLMTKKFSVNLTVAEEYYRKIFGKLIKPKIDLILGEYKGCIKDYKLDQAFNNKKYVSITEKSDVQLSHLHNTPKQRRRRDDEDGKDQTTEDALGEALATPSPIENQALLSSREDEIHPEDFTNGLTDCYTRMEDFKECTSLVELKGLCYWSPKLYKDALLSYALL